MRVSRRESGLAPRGEPTDRVGSGDENERGLHPGCGRTESAMARSVAQLVAHRDSEVDEAYFERSGDGGDHLAGGLFAPPFDLGEVLG